MRTKSKLEFHEKLQALRKGKGLTQEELAEYLFVSRTAVSKWESGRGYPNIDSLKAIAKFFSVTVDELLSGEEVLTIAQEENRQKEERFRDLVFGLLDCSIALFFFLPLFGQESAGRVEAVSLLSLTEGPDYLKAAYFGFVAAMVLVGLVNLALRSRPSPAWAGVKGKLSLLLHGAGILLFIVSLQPYGATLLFVFLVIKALMLIKWP